MGPWNIRHGYDSLVQSATGIANLNPNQKPQHLPAQTLDYVAGYLASFGAMEALKRRALDGGSYMVRLSLVQVANWLMSLGTVENYNTIEIPTREQVKNTLMVSNTSWGRVEHLKPLLKMSQTQPRYFSVPVPLGSNLPIW